HLEFSRIAVHGVLGIAAELVPVAIVQAVAAVLDEGARPFVEPHTSAILLSTLRSKRLFRWLERRVRVSEDCNGCDSVQVKPQSFNFKVGLVLAAVGDDPAFDRRPVGADPLEPFIRPHNISKTLWAILF